MKKITCYLLYMVLAISGCADAQDNKDRGEYRLMGRCEGCEAVFEYGDRELLPTDTLPEFHKYEPKIKLTGTIYKPDGQTPAPGVVLFIYHTNLEGKYPKRGDETGWARRQGYIRGWIKTDSTGRYAFYTFRPGSYGSGAAHIHAVILEPDGRYYYIEDYNFKGDPNLNPEDGSRNRGGSGIVHLEKEGDIRVVERNITLGLNIPGYE